MSAWLSASVEVQVIGTWSSLCYCHSIISCFIEIQSGLPFWCRLTQVSPDESVVIISRSSVSGSSQWQFIGTRCWLVSTLIHTHTRLTALFLGIPRWAGTRKVKPIWILLKQETVSGSGISWAVCKSAPRSRQTTMPAPHRSVFYRPDAFPAAQPTASKHWRQVCQIYVHLNFSQ